MPVRYTTLLLAILTLPAADLPAQVDNKPIREKFANPLHVVLDESYGEEYKTAVQELVPTYWDLSGYRFIGLTEMGEHTQDINNVFLLLVEDEGIDGDTREFEHVMTLAYFARAGRYRSNITGAPVKVRGRDVRGTVLHGLRVIQDKAHFEMRKEDEEVEEYWEVLDGRSDLLRSKTLYIARGDLKIDREDISRFYDGPVEVVASTEIERLMESEEADALLAVVHAFKIGGGYAITKDVLDARTGELLYAVVTGSVDAEGGFGKKDFKALGRR